MRAFADNLGDFRLFSTSTVAAWPVEAGNEADFHGVYVPREDDWNRGSSRLRCERSCRPAACRRGNYHHVAFIGSQALRRPSLGKRNGDFGLIAQQQFCDNDVRFVPKADILRCSKKRFYSISSSARVSSDGGTVRPSAFAALRLIVNSNLVGCCTGRSAGLAPLKIWSTYLAITRARSAKLAVYAIRPPACTADFWVERDG